MDLVGATVGMLSKMALIVSAKMGKVIVVKRILRTKKKNAIATSPCAEKTHALGPSGDHGATANSMPSATLEGKCIKRGEYTNQQQNNMNIKIM